MQLTNEQEKAILSGQAVEVTVSGKRCAVLPWDIYEKVKATLEYDDGEWTNEERMLLAAEAAEDLDAMGEIGK